MTEFKNITEMAARVSQALEAAGIRATLSGGAAVSIYSENQYQSVDLDFITSVRNQTIAPVLEALGFEYVRGRREFYHPRAEYYLEFPSGPLAFGETTISDEEATVIATEYGPVRIITPTQAVMDRLAPYLHWKDPQAFDQAVMVAKRHDIDWAQVKAWADREGAKPDLVERLRRLAASD